MEDDTPALTDSTMAALQAFLLERKNAAVAAEGDPFAEDWSMSQFWYSDETSHTVAVEVEAVCPPGGRVACIACPSLFRRLLQDHQDTSAQLLEFDERFAVLGDGFTYYDYNNPADLPAHLLGAFAVVVADPPYLAEECLDKTMETMRLLSAPGAVHYLLTGAVMRRVAWRGLQLRPVTFRPQHRNKLGNEFLLYCSYGGADATAPGRHGPETRLGGWDAELDPTVDEVAEGGHAAMAGQEAVTEAQKEAGLEGQE